MKMNERLHNIKYWLKAILKSFSFPVLTLILVILFFSFIITSINNCFIKLDEALTEQNTTLSREFGKLFGEIIKEFNEGVEESMEEDENGN